MKKGNLARKNTAIGLLLGMFLNITAFSDELIKARNGNTVRVTTAPNGVPMIELANPNGSGISVNDMERLSVDERNLILNNISPKEGTAYRSELGGIIAPNENYTGNPARAVLIRVHNDPSVIGGFIEAASTGKMDLIWSNERGITINGNSGLVGRFGNVTFTTGRVSDDMTEILVRDGRLEINGSFNGKASESLSLLAREIRINSELHANDLTVIGGEYDYNTGTKEVIKRGDNLDEVLISAVIVGSPYRNIYFKAVGSDLAVKGSLISERVMSINADGTLKLERIQSAENIDIKAEKFVQNGSTYAEGRLRIEAGSTVLNGIGTQASDIEITGNLENNNNIYSKGDVTVDGDVKSKGQLLSEGSLEVKGNLDSENIVYGKEEIKVGKNLKNVSDIQSEGNITVSEDTVNTGRILTEKNLNMKGKTVNHGTLYGKESVRTGKNLENSGNIQTSGDLTAKETANSGKLVSEGSISTDDLENSGEVTANKEFLTKSLDNKSTGKINTGEGIQVSENTINHGVINTNGDFMVNGSLENYNAVNAGMLNTKDLTNTGVLKVSDKIVSRGSVFTNNGEIVTENLDVDTVSILNTNKITVVETAKLKGSNINNQGSFVANNLELITPTLVNNGQILVSETITANNTSLTNTGKLASNTKLDLNNSSLVNRNTIESGEINLGNLLSYDNNTGLIRGNNINLTSSGNLLLEGKIQGIENLMISGLDITNNGTTVSSGLLRLSGRDISNTKTISAGNVELLATGNILNTSMIEGETGELSGNIIENKDLIIFLDKLDIEGTNLINRGASIYSDNELNIAVKDGMATKI